MRTIWWHKVLLLVGSLAVVLPGRAAMNAKKRKHKS